MSDNSEDEEFLGCYAKMLLATLPEEFRPSWIFITCPGNMKFLLPS